MQDFKNNPLITILLAIIVVISTAMFASNLNANNQLWNKLDRMTALYMAERDILRTDIRDQGKVILCLDQEVVRIKEKMENHIREYDRETEKRLKGK